jgi:heme exporter protein C
VNLTTGSKGTRIIGVATLFMAAVALAFGLIFSPPEVFMRDSVRLMYLHLPSVLVAYSAFAITLVGSIIYLRNRSDFWDLMAGSAAEIGVVFTAFVLLTGAIWGKPTWGVYWQWDPRLTSTTVMFIMYIGYLAVRRMELPRAVRSRRAAILGIVSFLNVIIVHNSVRWWRSLHQGRTLGLDTQLDGLHLFSLFLGAVTFVLLGAWLLIHRFRVAWLEYQLEAENFDRALAERREEGRGDLGNLGGAL